MRQDLVLDGAEVAGGHQAQPELRQVEHAVQLALTLHGQRRPGRPGRGASQRTSHQLVGVHLTGDHQVQQEERVCVDERRLGARPPPERQPVGLDRNVGAVTDPLNDPVGVQVEPTDVRPGRDQERPTAADEAEALLLLRDRGEPGRHAS